MARIASRFGDARVQLVAPDRQADADHRHPAASLGHGVGRPGANGRHRPEHVAHHLHVRLGADDLGASGDKLRPGRQRRLDGRPGRRRLRERERRERRHGAVRVQREARVEHGFCAAHFAHERARKRFEPGHLDLGAQHVGLRRGSAGVSGIRGADDVARERELLGDERRRSAGAPAPSGRRWPPVCRRPRWSGSPQRAADRHPPGRMRGGARECRTTGSVARS